MRLRAAHFACVLLLLSSLGAAEASAVQNARLGLGGQYVGALLQQAAAAANPDAATVEAGLGPEWKELRPESLAMYRTAWTMRPPAAQTAALQAVTAEGIERL